uniref:RHS repeat-associated core domain-containing protein n=1 Tax=Neisseria zalophi TaxID=640030 RepID=UPI00177B7EE2|nr:RHS repeat-associated core domain-containing protein [Neisseria zalophi]
MPTASKQVVACINISIQSVGCCALWARTLFFALIRLSEKKQIAELNAVTQPKGKNKTAAGHTAVKRSYGYDKTGNLMHSSDQRSGVTQFEYDKLGRITQADKETFAFDPAHNILSDGQKDKIADNRLKTYNGISYYYDDLGNLIHRELADGEVQNYFYDLHDQLVKVEIFKPEQEKETWVYSYDALGRRIGKGRLKNGQEVSDGLENKTDFIWDGSHLIQETRSDGLYTYIYTYKDSYEPLAQIRNWTNEEGESHQETNYFHCDQIGIPREMTDSEGKLLWFGDYYGWGKLKNETNIANAHQPFRLQNQYCDTETGLHYNFFRYYEPDCGRFVNQDPIGLWGGDNLYQFAKNIQVLLDTLGLKHTAVWQLFDKYGKPKTQPELIQSGCDKPPGRRLSWNEQLEVHTERKILDKVSNIIEPGDVLIILGEKSPCSPGGRGCQAAMQDFVNKNSDVKVVYMTQDQEWLFKSKCNKSDC